MRGTVVRSKQEASAGERPDQSARKRAAVDLIRNHDRQLRWTSRRFSMCAEDAEDAYQRGIEILLSKAPTTELNQLLPWARTVIKHEALAVRRNRERILTRPPASGEEEESEDWIQLIPATGDGPDEIAVRRERVARSREALALLKPAEMKALTQLAEGYSYREIGELNNWSYTKVNRCLSEGRARFRSVFRDSESGERCPEFEPLLSLACDGELGSEELESLEDHLAACGQCRATLRTYRAAPRAAAAIAPVLPVGRGLWERAQELALDVQLRLQGFGRDSDSALHGLLASGGARGGGAVALAKLATLCAGTAGTAAVCAATGVLPAPTLLEERSPRESAAAEVVKELAEPGPAPPAAGPVQPSPPVGASPSEETPPPAERPLPEPTQQVPDPPPAATPPPTPTDTEFTAEAAGTPVPTPTAAAPPASPIPPQSSNQVPVTNGGGEFTP